MATEMNPAWQAVPPPSIQIRGVEGRYRDRLNGHYALTPHNGPKPALTYVNPHNNSCVVYGEHEKDGKVGFTGWIAGWTRDNRPDDFFICAKGEVNLPDRKHSEGQLQWELRGNDGHFHNSDLIQIVPLREEISVPNDIAMSPANLGAKTPLGSGSTPMSNTNTNRNSTLKPPVPIPNVPEIVPYSSPHAADGTTPHFGGPVRHRANQAKAMMSADVLAAAGASGAWTTPWSATQAAVGFHMDNAVETTKWKGKEKQRPSLLKQKTDGELRSDAPSFVPAGKGLAPEIEEGVQRGISNQLLEESASHAAGGLLVSARKVSWTIQEDTKNGEAVDSPVFRLQSSSGRTGPPMQLRFYPRSVEDRLGYVTMQLLCHQGVRMKFKLFCDAQNSGNKVLMGTKYTMDFTDPKLNKEEGASPRASARGKRPNHRLMVVGLELLDWM